MKDVFNLKTLLPSYDNQLQGYNHIGDRIILSVFIIFFCIVGLVGNGNVIWLLGFRIKRKPFAIYILNLAVADFGALLCLLAVNLSLSPPSFDELLDLPLVLLFLFLSLLLFMDSSCHLLLTAIGIDRWVSLLSPNWYRRQQSWVLPTLVCAFMWALSLSISGMPLFLLFNDLMSEDYVIVFLLGFCVTISIGLLLMVISTLALFVIVCLKSQCCQCGKLLKVILLILLSFLLFTILKYGSLVSPHISRQYCFLWISLKSSINPLIYFLAGRQNSGKFQERMKVTLQRVFKEETDTRMELQTCTQTVL